MDDISDRLERLEEAYEDASQTLYDLYTDDRLRELEEKSVLSHLSASERYEREARNDANVIRRFQEESADIESEDELDELYEEARSELELDDTGIIGLPSIESIQENGPRRAAKYAAKRVFSAHVAVAVEVEYVIGNTLRRARSLEEEGDELEAELMEAAARDQLLFTDPETSEDRLEDIYDRRRSDDSIASDIIKSIGTTFPFY